MRMILRWVAVPSILLGAWAAPLPAGASPPAAGQIYTVNSALDEADSDPTDGICSSTPSGLCTLRAAIMQANTHAGADTIQLPAGVYTLTRVGEDDSGLNGDLDIADSVTLLGASADRTIIDGNGALTGDRVIQIFYSAVTISGVTIEHGDRPTVWMAGLPDGGGIYNTGDTPLTLVSSTVSGNYASAAGGGIYGPATIVNSIVSGNQAGAGGGLYGPATIVSSTIAGNFASENGGGLNAAGQLTVKRSTINGNTGGMGGGIYASGSLTLTNSTIEGNTSGGSAGGLFINGSGQLLNTTLTNNYANATVLTGFGGGIYVDSWSALTLTNSIVAGNLIRLPGHVIPLDACYVSDAGAGLTAAGNNILYTVDPSHCFINGAYSGVDPRLGPLQDNGGPTLTQALLPGSPAIDAGDPTGCSDGAGGIITTDQRGAPRPVAGCDIGAYELVPEADLAVGQRDSPDPARVGAPLTYTVFVTNTGAAPATGVVLTDTLPLSVTVATITPSQGSCLGTVTITCNLGSLASGNHVTLMVAVTPTAAGVITNWVNVTANEFDPALANNTASETTAVVAAAPQRLYLPIVRR